MPQWPCCQLGAHRRVLRIHSPAEERGVPPPLCTQVLQLHALAGDLQGLAANAGIDENMESLELGELFLLEVAANPDTLVLQVALALHRLVGHVLVPVPQ